VAERTHLLPLELLPPQTLHLVPLGWHKTLTHLEPPFGHPCSQKSFLNLLGQWDELEHSGKTASNSVPLSWGIYCVPVSPALEC
jgi:hypothetical protein